MKIDCLHGFFQFREERSGEISEFASLFGLDLVKEYSYFTFKGLETAPLFSIKGGSYLGGPATKTFSGQPWQVMRENLLVFDLSRGLVVNRNTVTVRTELSQAGPYFVSPGLINPGSLIQDGRRVVSYSGFYSFGSGRFRYSEVERV